MNEHPSVIATRNRVPHSRQRINVLWLIKGLGLGGAETLLLSASRHLDDESFHYRAGYFLPWKDALVPDLRAAGIGVTCFGINSHADPRAVTRLARYVRDHDIHVIHAHLPYPGVVARTVGKLTGAKVVYTEHNVWTRLNPVMRFANRITFDLNAYAIAVSQEVADSMAGVDCERVEVVENGIDYERLAATPDDSAAVRAEFGVPASDFLVGKVANLTPKKNHDALLVAFAGLHARRPDSSLLLVGQFAGRDAALRQRAESLGIAHKVIMTGPRNDVPRLLRALDAFAISSDFEGLPVAMLEAMAIGVPVVATTVGGIPGVVQDGEHGLLVPPRRPDLLGSALVALAAEPALARAMAARAQRRVHEHFDISRMVRRVESIYHRVSHG